MKEKQNNWQRIEAVIKWANMTTNYFARHIGLSRGENLYQIKRGNNGISLDVADRVVAKFPQISKLWLLTGEGQMFVAKELLGILIPYYDVELEQGLSRLEDFEPDCNLILPPLGECDLAMPYSGRAMGSIVPSGSIVFLRAVERDAIIPGEEYAIVCRKFVTLRIVRASDKTDELRLVPGDRDNFDDMLLNVKEILAVYKVKGKLTINN